MDKRYQECAFIVGLQIYSMQINEEVIWYTKLVRILNGRLTQKEVSRSIDFISDMGWTKERNDEWNPWQMHNGKWCKVINLESYAMDYYRKFLEE